MELDIFITSNLDLLKVGGAMTGRSTLLAKRFFNSSTLINIDKNVIVMSMYLKNGLTDLEFKSIYYHEVGHFLKKHHIEPGKSLPWYSKELDADAYAVKMMGPRILLTALEKIPAIIRNCQPLRQSAKHLVTDESYYRELDIFLNGVNNGMQFRYNALRKML
jgi:Zn-dependent protease with chaperone function